MGNKIIIIQGLIEISLKIRRKGQSGFLYIFVSAAKKNMLKKQYRRYNHSFSRLIKNNLKAK